MSKNKVLNRNNEPTEELQRSIVKVIDGVEYNYNEVYYLDFEVDENTGMVNKDHSVAHYTKDQVERNMKAHKTAYMIAKGSVAPTEIIEFRTKHKIAASALSIILGFSKNTISNIENDGIASLATGRFIKVCLSNTSLLSEYIKSCSTLDIPKKNEILERISVN